MTVLVTGASGYIGSHTIVELLETGHEVVGVDNFYNSNYDPITNIKEITNKDFAFYAIDLKDYLVLDNIFNKHKVDCIMHFAGYKAVAESVAKPLDYYQNNLNTTINLCQAMQKHSTKHFIFSSSATVYKPDNPMPLKEDAPFLGAINPYGWTKYMSEQILKDAAYANPEWSVVLLRYFNPVGAHPSGKIGENPSGIPNNIMPYIAQAAKGIRKILPVTGNDYDTPDGTGVRDYIHVVDLAKGHVAALNCAEKNKGVEIFNLGTGRGYSVLEMIHAFERVNGVKVPYEIAPRRPGDSAVSYSDPSKAQKMLNWKAEKTLDEMCADTWRYQSQS